MTTTIDKCRGIAIKVGDAGTDKVNGNYYLTEKDHNSFPIYSKTGRFDNLLDGTVIIFFDKIKCYIGHMGVGGKNLYEAVQFQAGVPPEEGWVKLNGDDPPPKVFIGEFRNKKRRANLLRNIQKMLFSQTFSDVHFHCPDGTILHAHKSILSVTSPYFATVFEGPWGDKHPDDIWNTSNSADVMKVVLTFMYSDIDIKDEIDKQPLTILSLAHEYQMDEFVKTIEEILMKNIGFDNVKEMLQTSCLYNLKDLKQSCYIFIKKNLVKVLLDINFIKLSVEDESIWKELQATVQ